MERRGTTGVAGVAGPPRRPASPPGRRCFPSGCCWSGCAAASRTAFPIPGAMRSCCRSAPAVRARARARLHAGARNLPHPLARLGGAARQPLCADRLSALPLRAPGRAGARRITNPDAPEERHYVQLAGGRGAWVPLQLARPVAAPPPALAESLDFQLLAVDVADGVCTARRRRRRLGRWPRPPRCRACSP